MYYPNKNKVTYSGPLYNVGYFLMCLKKYLPLRRVGTNFRFADGVVEYGTYLKYNYC